MPGSTVGPSSAIRSSVIALRPGGLLASADRLRLSVQGRQTHASMPWRGVDPVVISAQIILALQTIVTRQIDSTITPAVLSIATIHGGLRGNILPDGVTMEGTLRVHDETVRADIKRRIEKTAVAIADAAGATASLEVGRSEALERCQVIKDLLESEWAEAGRAYSRDRKGLFEAPRP